MHSVLGSRLIYSDMLPITLILAHFGAMCRMLDQILPCSRKAVNSQTSEAGISEEVKPVIFRRVVQGAKQYVQDLDFWSSLQAFGS